MTVSLPEFAGDQVVAFVIVMARVGGLFVLAPVFSGRMIPMQVKLILAGAISFSLAPLVTADTTMPSGLAIVPVMVKEVIVGLALALGLGAVAAAIQFAASIMDTMIGFSYAALIDPMTSAPSAILGQFYSLFATLVFLLIGGDRLMIEGLAASYRLIPVNEMPSPTSLGVLATNDLQQVATIGLEIGAPVILALVLVDVAFGFIARTVPQMNVFVVGIPAKILVGFAAIGASLAFVAGDIGTLAQQAMTQTLIALRIH